MGLEPFVARLGILTDAERNTVDNFLNSIAARLSSASEQYRFDDSGRLEVRNLLQKPAAAGIMKTPFGLYHALRNGFLELDLDPPPPEYPRQAESQTPDANASADQQLEQRSGAIQRAVGRLLGRRLDPASGATRPAARFHSVHSSDMSTPGHTRALESLGAWVTARRADGTLLPAMRQWADRQEKYGIARRLADERRLNGFSPEVRRALAGHITQAILDRLPEWYLQLGGGPDSRAQLPMRIQGEFDQLARWLFEELDSFEGGARRSDD